MVPTQVSWSKRLPNFCLQLRNSTYKVFAMLFSNKTIRPTKTVGVIIRLPPAVAGQTIYHYRCRSSSELLGFCFMFVGWLVAAILPHKNEALRRGLPTSRNVPSVKTLVVAGLAFAPAAAIVVFFLALFIGFSIPRAERPEC
jgi:hypothetical protein